MDNNNFLEKFQCERQHKNGELAEGGYQGKEAFVFVAVFAFFLVLFVCFGNMRACLIQMVMT